MHSKHESLFIPNEYYKWLYERYSYSRKTIVIKNNYRKLLGRIVVNHKIIIFLC